ncbi:radical SAM protein [Candidatus Fermentibacteria bacterium]|nr:radical SAM protein [Candidatus Fermentibacteria bacterium]
MTSPTRSITNLHETNFHVGTLSPSCSSCLQGGMLVVGVTELCTRACYYCPNPPERTDQSYAGDIVARSDGDILREARLINASSACITGGEPLLKPERAARFIALLKEEFGPEFQTHLYTCMASISHKTFRLLRDAGLDEIRFHLHAPGDTRAVEAARDYQWRVGIEIPCIPKPWGAVEEIVETALRLGIHLVNLNEFQMAQSNHEALLQRGMRPVGTIPDEIGGTPVTDETRRALFNDTRFLMTMQVSGSRELGMALLEEAVTWSDDAPTLHLCTTASKFTVQKVRRDRRRAQSVALPCDEVNERGCLLFGRVVCPDATVASAVEAMAVDNDVPAERIRRYGRVVELPWFHAARLKNRLAAEAPGTVVAVCEESSYQRQRPVEDLGGEPAKGHGQKPPAGAGPLGRNQKG